jgi:putative acetyltransferase
MPRGQWALCPVRRRNARLPGSRSPNAHRLETQQIPAVALTTPTRPAEFESLRKILREYAHGLGVDLCFQDFDQELASLPGEYVPPRGALLLAMVDGEVAGCCALRAIDNADYPNACEMKRLYVRHAFRGRGLGRQLAEAAMDAARQGGYSCVLLDTLNDMEAARALYGDLGFHEIPPYYHNPIPGAHYLKADL